MYIASHIPVRIVLLLYIRILYYDYYPYAIICHIISKLHVTYFSPMYVCAKEGSFVKPRIDW